MRLKKIEPIGINKVAITDSLFWSEKLNKNLELTIPYQYQVCKDTGRFDFFQYDKIENPDFEPHIFWSSDTAKWLEAAAHSLGTKKDPKFEAELDGIIDIMISAQTEDGYLNPYFTFIAPQHRWRYLEWYHELYCAGHLIEAAVAYYNATGKDKFLKALCRFADHIAEVFGTDEGQMLGYPGHQEIELALVKLYDATGNQKYLDLADYFIAQRGKQPHWFDKEKQEAETDPDIQQDHVDHHRVDYTYSQSHLPPIEQTTAEGHCVRACYMYSGMAELANRTGNEKLLQACDAIWNDIISSKLYITGGIGSAYMSERFTIPGDLSDEEAYAETCASIALLFFGYSMFGATGRGHYIDTAEVALYNTICGGIGADYKTFFYANPLTNVPAITDYKFSHQGIELACSERQGWFSVACCPPNIARLYASLGTYLYGTGENELFVHLYASSKASVKFADTEIQISQQTKYPYDGSVRFDIKLDKEQQGTISLRIPQWCDDFSIKINGQSLESSSVQDGYAKIDRTWCDGDVIEFDMAMPVKVYRPGAVVIQNAGRVALQRGPIVYCVESVDNGEKLDQLIVDVENANFEILEKDFDFGNVAAIQFNALRTVPAGDELYTTNKPQSKKVTITAIPFYLRANRGPVEFRVWLRESIG
ncbi:MAG: glycoside hydrolase family 127 protein [Planctomycetota bacterium]|jgi:DUF1680 family protein